MKSILSIKENSASQARGSLKSAYRRGFSRGLTLGLILLAAVIVLSGGMLHGEGVVDALFIDDKGTVKVQELEVNGTTNLGDTLTVDGATTFKNNLTVNGNVGIGTTNPTAALEVQTGRIKDKTGFVMPVGTILPYGGKEVPIGWLECNGKEVSWKEYADLFGAIGTLWGKGKKPNTFNLPDLRGQFLRGQDHGAKVDPDINLRRNKYDGGATKDSVGSYQGDEIKTHTHRFNFTGVRYINNAYGGPPSARRKRHIQGAQDDHNEKSIRIENYGGRETRPKNAYVMFIIKH